MAYVLLYATAVRCISIVFATCVVVATPHHAWCEIAARSPSTVVAGLVDNDPANDAVEAVAQEIAASLHIERIGQSHRWQLDIRDDYEAPPDNEREDATREVYELCPDEAVPPPPSNALEQAAATLYRVIGEHPNTVPPTRTAFWPRYLFAARHATTCLDRGNRADHVHVTVFADGDREWTLYRDGIDVHASTGSASFDVEVIAGRPAYFHARCGRDVRCSRTIEVKDTTHPVAVYIDAVGTRLYGRMSDTSLAIAYTSDVARNNHIGFDAALTAYVLAAAHAPRGDAIGVVSEGDDFRLVYSNADGVPLRTLRAPRESIVKAAERLVDGASDLAAGAYAPGKHRVVVDIEAGAPAITDAQSNFDHTLRTTRPFCTRSHCEIGSPPGTLRMRFDETRWGGPLEKRVTLDKDLLVTVKPGRRYWAKYSGMGLMGAGIVGVGSVLATGLLEKLALDGLCSAIPTSGPASDCDTDVPLARWQQVALGTGAGALAVGAFLYLVVHKKPRINVAPLGGVGIAF